ncbi:YkyA family protein [Halalkalibacter hemicellulosilyticus]|uniref:Lipoprotein n=1 Tax=Halalkalibacter hemicellulosilyticusJCM 9152 TaxID=1236971 RepID=W4QE33_9BACI|nr:YkyA family protein [Halalkalibacter hemicellulosilyticus]GAE29908.1 lipoprotein [Halalkalibacter hemicellulosilyticusJCM 9152]
MKYIQYLLIIGLACFVLTACGGNPAQDVYEHLETAVELERPFEEQQQSLYQAEERENELFDEVITLGTSELDEIEPLIEEALESIETRLSMIEIEEESIEASFHEFSEIEQYENQFNETELEELFSSLLETMNTRYEAYHSLNEVYKEAAQADQDLFEAFLDEDLTLERLQELVDQVNDYYEAVDQQTQSFNRATDLYNESKRKFYEASDLNITYE